MHRLIAAAAVLPALLATNAFAQTVTDEVNMQLWCGTAMVVAFSNLPAELTDEQRAEAQGYLDGGAALVELAIQAHLDAGFTQEAADKIKQDIVPVVTEQVMGDGSNAEHTFEECLAISHALSHRWGISKASHALGIVARRLGKFAVARTRIEESLAIDREMGNQPGVADGLLALGNIAYDDGDYAASRAMFQQSLALWRKLGTTWGVCYTLSGLASVVAAEGDALRAARIWGHAELLAETVSKGARPADEQRIAGARAAFDNDALFTSAWREGRGMTLERAIELASSAVPRP